MKTIKVNNTLLSGLSLVLIMFALFPQFAKSETFDGKEIASFLPTLEKTKKRQPKLDSETGLYVEQVKEKLFYVTDGIYQSAFLETTEGVVIFDAPPSFGDKLPAIIKQHAPKQDIKYLVYSHGHKDHIGASGLFKSVEGLQVIAQESVAESLIHRANPDILIPTILYKDFYNFALGQDRIEVINQGHFHSNDADSFVYLPKQKFLIAVDTLSAAYVPFKGFEVTPDFGRYLSVFDDILSFDFDLLLSGHLDILGTRQDVLDSKEYTLDVKSTIENVVKTASAGEIFGQVAEALQGRSNSYLSYGFYLEILAKQCGRQIIDKWKDRLAWVDVWADGHCDKALIYTLLH